jgi:hypothetical protein
MQCRHFSRHVGGIGQVAEVFENRSNTGGFGRGFVGFHVLASRGERWPQAYTAGTNQWSDE